MAGELGKHGITVTAVAPGFIETEMSDAYSGERREAVIASIPVKHAGTVLDIASAVGFLASDASGFINGAVLDVNGGGYM
jgi:NAD(P)-dependent dehydrogenase (short-subunit alcohol dehydrogenase family)